GSISGNSVRTNKRSASQRLASSMAGSNAVSAIGEPSSGTRMVFNMTVLLCAHRSHEPQAPLAVLPSAISCDLRRTYPSPVALGVEAGCKTVKAGNSWIWLAWEGARVGDRSMRRGIPSAIRRLSEVLYDQ